MNKVVLDIETSVTFDEKGKYSSSPYSSNNMLVSVGIKYVDSGDTEYLFFNHEEVSQEIMSASKRRLQNILDNTQLVIGHNLKFDMSWLYECGFTYENSLYDTMIFEYVAGKGQKPQLSLAACAERYGLDPKKDILSSYLDAGTNTNQVPLQELQEYGIQDIETTYQLYMLQRKRYAEEKDIKTMWPAIKLTNETLEVLIDIERNGIKIDVEELDKVEQQFKQEKTELEIKLNTLVRSVMGDTKINLASSDDMTQVVYGIKVKDKKLWAETFNIGMEQRGAVKKKKYLKRHTYQELRDVIRKQTEPVFKTDAVHCAACDGKGYTQKITKTGVPFKKLTKCKECNGSKVLYIPNGSRAGFGVAPLSYEYATSSGFSTDKITIDDLVEAGKLSEQAEIFITSLQRLNAIDTYLSSFVNGIRKGIVAGGVTHPNFNQCVTSTGRLSSSGPNYQNFPRGNTFPIRRVFISRFEDGLMCPTDFAALEYRTAVMLARCEAGLKSIVEGKDRHQLSAEVIFGAVKEDMEADDWKEVRQKAKSSTFSPLYGGGNANEKLMAYKEAFFAEHTGISAWHEELVTEALTYKQITTPSGRIFAFPNVKRGENGRVVGKTQLVNYPVQSFATADLAWCVIIPLWREMKKLKLRSCIVLQVHDDVVIDVCFEEKDQVLALVKKHFHNTLIYLTERFNYVTNVPIGFEISIGKNLIDKEGVYSA